MPELGSITPISKEAGEALPPSSDNIRQAIVLGSIVIFAAFGGFIAWATFSELESAVIAPGSIKVLGNKKIVQPLEGGVVKELNVKNGDQVKTGDVVLRLDDTRARATFKIIRGSYDAVRSTVYRLKAERDGLDEPQFPDDILDRVNNSSVLEILDGQIKLFHARRATFFGQINLIKAKIGQLNEEARGVRAQASAKEKQIRLIREELEGLGELFKKGFASKTRILALEREQARLEGQRGEHVAGIARTKRQISEAELEIVSMKQGALQRVVQVLREKEEEMYALSEKLSAAKYTLSQTLIRSTATGIVVGLSVNTVGSIVESSRTLFEIVPLEGELVVEAQVLPVDVDNVFLGLEAEVRFTAFSQRTTPKTTGRVVYVSADSVEGDNATKPYFLVHVSVSQKELAALGVGKVVPGMLAEVLIRTGHRSPISYLFEPLADSMRKAWRDS